MKNLSVEERNEQFEKLSVTKRRIVIAKDVLNQMRTGFLVPKSGIYVRSNELSKASNDDLELKEVFDKDKRCIACGIGSLFVCSVKLFNKLKLADVATNYSMFSPFEISKENIHQYLKEYFSEFELDKIEAAFEKTDSLYNRSIYTKGKITTITNASKYFDTPAGSNLNGKQRLKAIMNNIIKNNGIFKVSKGYGNK